MHSTLNSVQIKGDKDVRKVTKMELMLSGADESFTPHQSNAPKTMKPREKWSSSQAASDFVNFLSKIPEIVMHRIQSGAV